MIIEFCGKNIEFTESMKAFVTKKALSLEKHLKHNDAKLRVSAEIVGGQQVATLLLDDNGKVYSAISHSTDFYDASLASLKRLKDQLETAKSKGISKKLAATPLYQITEPCEDVPDSLGSECVCCFHYVVPETQQEEQLDVEIDETDKGWLRNAYSEWLQFCEDMGLPEDCLRDVEVFGIEDAGCEGVAIETF